MVEPSVRGEAALHKRKSSTLTQEADTPRKNSVLARNVTSITPSVRFESIVREELDGGQVLAAGEDVVPTIARRTLQEILQIE